MKPCLPQHETNPSRRLHRLDSARRDYAFRHDYHDLVAAVSLPLKEKTDPRYWAGLAEVSAKLAANKLASKLRPDPPVIYDKMYSTIPLPQIASCWRRDDVFAWQAVAGTNPVMLRRMTRFDDRFPITNARYQRAVTNGDTLDAALGDGRLYIADYAVLDGLPPGTTSEGQLKHNFAPIALYAWQPGAGELVAVAIQCGQDPSVNPIFGPPDGASWLMARTTVSIAEGNYQGILSHFALCHQVMESVILAAHRQLAADHPLLVLLSPHFDNTMITNNIAMSGLVGPGGYMERLQSPTLEASLALATRVIHTFELTESAPRKDFAARGVDDVGALGVYPVRDDGLLVWDATLPFLEAYVRLSYTSDAEVAADVELAAWVDEMGSHDGGRLTGVARPATVAGLVDLIAQIVFRCTAYHASINYSSFDLFGYTPNVQAAGFAPGPTGTAADTGEARDAMLPPYDAAFDGFTLFYEITLQLNRIGEYPAGHFADERVAPLLQQYQARLGEVEDVITTRNTTRKLAYPYQLPSRISRSIHV